jgi:geranylgeranyl pyrophosphate synthase
MTPEKKLMERVIAIFEERGKNAVEASRQLAQQGNKLQGPLKEALQYFLDEFWFDALHPALVSLACEAVGGKPEDTTEVSAAIVLIAGAADIHDDIIDQSNVKGPLPTVLGKFGRDVAILLGDALLVSGLYALHEACGHFKVEKRQEILNSVREAFVEVSDGEAREAGLRGKLDVSLEYWLETVKLKVAAAEATTRIGAIIGGGAKKDVELLSHYGRTFGVLMSLRNDFIDSFEAAELLSRAKNECLPIPILLAMHDKKRKKEILHLLEAADLNEKTVERILDLSMDSDVTRNLVVEMRHWVEKERLSLPPAFRCRDILDLILIATVEDL